jgi:ArsR family transcriptional regulator, arsenate/arsenite/antimonite-responsive transcriptional repressor
MDNEMSLQVLKALADPTRLHIVEFLSQCQSGKANILEDGGIEGPTAGEVCCHITGAEKISSTVSHHLHELENAGIVKLERRGKTTICTLVPASLIGLSDHLINLSSGENQTGCC